MRWAFVASLAIAACDRRIELAPPADPDARSALVALDSQQGLELHAFSVTDTPARIERKVDGAARVTALFYRETLEQLSLTAGVVPVVRPGEASRHLPVPTAGGWTSVLDGGEAGPWVAVDGLEGPLASLQIAGVLDDCARAEVVVMSQAYAEDSRFRDVAVIGSTLAFALWESPDGFTKFVRMVRGAPLEEIVLRATPSGVATDHRGTVFVSAYDLTVRQLDAMGVERTRTRLPFLPRVTVARDGTPFAWGGQSIVELHTGTDSFVELPRIPVAAVDVFAAARDRIVASAVGELWFFDGTEWRVEYRGELIGDDEVVFGDEAKLVSTTANYSVMERDEASRTWIEVQPPRDLFAMVGGVGLGGGRYYVIGTFGVAFLNLGEWCGDTLNTGTNQNFSAIDAVPGTPTALAVLKSEGSGIPALALWLESLRL